MKEVVLNRGVALVDDEDFELVSQYNWYALEDGRTTYAYTNIPAPPDSKGYGKRTTIQMHRLIMGFPSSGIDHEDGNGLNNQRRNLRPATKKQNGQNAKVSKASKTGVKGVCWHSQAGKWRAYIVVDRKQKSLGLFDDIKGAAEARHRAAQQMFGEFASSVEGQC